MIAKARRRVETRKSDYAWALWSPHYGVINSTVRRTRTKALAVYFESKHWPKWYRDGWRIVRVEVTAIYFSSSGAAMKRVP